MNWERKCAVVRSIMWCLQLQRFEHHLTPPLAMDLVSWLQLALHLAPPPWPHDLWLLQHQLRHPPCTILQFCPPFWSSLPPWCLSLESSLPTTAVAYVLCDSPGPFPPSLWSSSTCHLQGSLLPCIPLQLVVRSLPFLPLYPSLECPFPLSQFVCSLHSPRPYRAHSRCSSPSRHTHSFCVLLFILLHLHLHLHLRPKCWGSWCRRNHRGSQVRQVCRFFSAISGGTHTHSLPRCHRFRVIVWSCGL